MAPLGIAALIDAASARLAGLPNPALDAELLLRGVSGLSREAILASPKSVLPTEVEAAFESAVERRERHEPVQYILGQAAFWRDEFVVSRAVLIPRPDTETLVEAVAARLRATPSPHLLDLGTGSGCIALSLLRELPQAHAVALDISEPALEVARQNAARLGLASRIEIRFSRWFEGIAPMETFDAIVSNPPYVAPGDETRLPREVREHEPALALFADRDDDLSSYRAIASGISGRLRPSGLVAVEVGMGQAGRVAELLSQTGLRAIEVLPDLSGIERVVLGRSS